jgi:hypothetical protein
MDATLQALIAAHEAERDHRSAAAGARRAAVLALHAAGRLRSPAERFAAASLLVHGERLADVEAAHALALAALRTEAGARRLAATAYDRLRLLRGEPQKFGTQWVERDGRRELWTVDAATTDSERAKWDLPPLAQLRARG